MDLTTLVSGHLRYLGLGSPLIGESNSIELQAPVWRLGKERQLAQQSRFGGKPRIAMGIFQGQPLQLPELGLCSAKLGGLLGEVDVRAGSGVAGARIGR